ncbi:nicolin-1-like isoform X6 [Haliotis rufescens]|uniref:nicolin-1-like isoform X6 n=1 Tax=Haliotis rufescens TaxID=6454 RepID=UPI001EB0508C|nr:nicolin-1-like isoform X6 [Haliotis rufescens]
MTEKPLHSNVKNPVMLFVGDPKSEFHSGCKVFDVTFPNVIHPEDEEVEEGVKVGEIRFKNHYVGILTVRAKFRSAENNGEPGELKWRTCLRRMKLMPSPHTESGSQDYFSLTRKHLLFDLVNLTALRFVLQQPSPVWRDFKLEELKVFRTSMMPRSAPLPAWLTEEPTEPSDRKIPGVPNLESLSANLQELWALAEVVSANQTTVNLGRYEVDGCYDINLLSYT